MAAEPPEREPVARRAAAKLDRPAYAQQKTMQALVWHAPGRVATEEVPRPTLGSAGDAILGVRLAAVSGSDLHHYTGATPTMMDGDVLGHEFVGVVEETGPEVRDVRVGDRVVVSGVIGCGECAFCRDGLTSLCDTTNQSPALEVMYGHSVAGVFGHSHLFGGFPGGQAGFVRVPFADFNCLPLPQEVTDEQAVGLSDTWCAAWMAAEYAGATAGMTLAVWGLGPVGLATMEAARARGVTRFIGVDRVPERLALARSRFGAEVINYSQEDPVSRVAQLTRRRGPDAVVDATGFRFAKSVRHEVQRRLGLETDSVDALSECIKAVRKGGTVVVIADYIGLANQFPLGAVMEKGLTVRTGRVHVHRYWREVMAAMQRGEYDPTFVLTHRFPLDEAPQAYQMWDKKQDGLVKAVLKP